MNLTIFTAGEQAQHIIRQQAASPIRIIRRHSCGAIFSLCCALVSQLLRFILHFDCGIDRLLVDFMGRKLDLQFRLLLGRSPIRRPQSRIDD